MPTTAPGHPTLNAIGLRWKRLGRRRVGLLAVLVLVGCTGLYRWWTSWPVRLVLPGPYLTWPSTFSQDGQTLVTSGFDGVTFWDLSDGTKRSRWSLPEPTDWFPIGDGLSPDGRTFVTSWSPKHSEAQTINLIEVSTGRTRATIPAGDGAWLEGHRYSTDGRALHLIVGHESAIEIIECDVATGRVSKRTSIATEKGTMHYLGHGFSADGRELRLVIGYLETAEVITWDTAAGRVSRKHPFSARLDWSTSRMVLSAEAQLLVVSPRVASPQLGVSTDVLIWDVDQDGEVGRLPGGVGGRDVSALDISSDWTVLGLAREDGSIEFWDLGARRLRATFRGHRPGFVSQLIRLAPDGSALASVATLQYGRALTVTSVSWQVRLEADRWFGVRRKGLAAEPPIDMVVLDTRTGRPLGRALPEGAPLFSKDGRTLATTDWSTIKVREILPTP